MKLKTKFQDEDFDLGEVVDVRIITLAKSGFQLQGEAKAGGLITIYYKSLEELYGKWEDVPEEPKEYYQITSRGNINFVEYTDDEIDKDHKQIGNYFETIEEAERAVEKLKAITRLQKNGFKFKGWRTADLGADKYYFVITSECDGAGKGDLDLLFGGEE